MKNVLDYLEASVLRHPDKVAVVDENGKCTYRELSESALKIGMTIAKITGPRRPVVVFMDKSITALKAFMGIVYAGCFYTLLDPSFPADRISSILGILDTELVLTNEKYRAKLEDSGYNGKVLIVDEILAADISDEDGHVLKNIRQGMVDTDPLYCNFTSGSTGVPKGVLVAHRSVIDFIDCFTETFKITENDVIGNQAPFDFDVSVKDIYSSLKLGATLVIIPKSYFMFPNAVVDMIENNGVTTLIWAVSALCMLSRLHGLKYKAPDSINKILFSGEQMPVKQLNVWRSYYPDAMFVNLYGPTEITCNCTYHVLDREYGEDERLPIGRAFSNERVFLLNDDNAEITADMHNVPGELCVAGTALALGYYRNPEMTGKAFTLNPLNKDYPEMIYHTGDLAYWGEDGCLYFAGRKDFQIKHMGHRIELEEIESVLGAVSLVEQACCFFDEVKSKIVAYYAGSDDKKAILAEMKQRVPDYMVPNILICVDELPLNKNGKTDRNKLKELYNKKE